LCLLNQFIFLVSTSSTPTVAVISYLLLFFLTFSLFPFCALTPYHRTMRLADVSALSELAKKKGILHVCDATFATPAMMQPIKLGADVCIVSTTKFYCGHNMTVK